MAWTRMYLPNYGTGRTCTRFIFDTEWALGGKKLLLSTERKKMGHLQLMLPEDTALFKLFTLLYFILEMEISLKTIRIFLPFCVDKSCAVVSSVKEAPVLCSPVFRYLTWKQGKYWHHHFLFVSSALFSFAILLHFIHVSSIFWSSTVSPIILSNIKLL